LSIPVIGVIEPGAQAALNLDREGDIGVLATPSTVSSQAYARALANLGFSGAVHERACPLFVPLVEEGWTDGEVPRLVAERYLNALPPDISRIILGCTHYPLLRPLLEAMAGEDRIFVDGGEATALALKTSLAENGLLTREEKSGVHRFLVTDAPERMSSLAHRFLGKALSPGEVEVVDVGMAR
jgi:glutamate racemase